MNIFAQPLGKSKDTHRISGEIIALIKISLRPQENNFDFQLLK